MSATVSFACQSWRRATHVPGRSHEHALEIDQEGVWALVGSGKRVRQESLESGFVEVLRVSTVHLFPVDYDAVDTEDRGRPGFVSD